jgi:hypothetical protein
LSAFCWKLLDLISSREMPSYFCPFIFGFFIHQNLQLLISPNDHELFWDLFSNTDHIYLSLIWLFDLILILIVHSIFRRFRLLLFWWFLLLVVQNSFLLWECFVCFIHTFWLTTFIIFSEKEMEADELHKYLLL